MSLNALNSALEGFQRSLSPEERVQFNSLSGGTPTADDVLRFTEEINEKGSSSRSRLWAQRLSGILTSVQQYCAIADTLIQANPTISALVWGSVKFVLMAAINFSDYFDSLLRRFEQLGTYCPRLREYEKLFGGSTRVREALSNFYACVVEFCTKALGVIQEKAVKRLAKSLVKPFKDDFGPLEAKLAAAKNEVDEELRLASEQKADSNRKIQLLEYKENERHRVGFLAEVKENQKERKANKFFRVLQLTDMATKNQLIAQKAVKEEERSRVRLHRQISKYDYTRSLRIGRGIRSNDTGGWLLERAEYREWRDGTTGRALWFCGTAGCGKTIISGSVIDRLMTSPESVGKRVVYYFFTSQQAESLSIPTFLRSILHQVLRSDEITPDLARRLEEIFIGTTGTREPDFMELEKLITDVCATLTEVVIVIDGLDEATRDDRRTVLNFMKGIESCSRAKFFVASQPEADVAKVLSHCVTINITARDLEDEIQKFVQIQFDMDSALKDWFSGFKPAFAQQFITILAMKAQGMFLWVDLILKEIRAACEDGEAALKVPRLMDDLPDGIEKLYSRILDKIMETGRERAEMALKIFQWVICANRPLKLGELKEAVTISVGQKAWEEPRRKLSWPRLSRLCGNLLSFDASDESIFLAHHSVLQFLQAPTATSTKKFHFDPEEADRHIGEICITYLNFADFEKSLTRSPDSSKIRPLDKPLEVGRQLEILPEFVKRHLPVGSTHAQNVLERHGFSVEEQLRKAMATNRITEVSPQFALLEYCRTNWYHHCGAFTSEKDQSNFSKVQLLVTRKQLPFHWRPWESSHKLRPYPHWDMFYWAVCRAHIPVFESWEKKVEASEYTGSWGRLWETDGQSILRSACATANLDQVELLLRGLNSRGIAGTTRAEALTAALISGASAGHVAVVKHLIQEGCYINDRHRGWTALQAAAGGGHLAVVERLLQEKADVNAAAASNSDRTALQAAAGGGHLAVVERLLQEKADVNPEASTFGRTALQAAAEGGHLAVIERLKQAGARR